MTERDSAVPCVAERAEGDNVVFLSNDTVVTERWLNHLAAAANVAPDDRSGTKILQVTVDLFLPACQHGTWV